MEFNMSSRQNQLLHLETYINEVDTEVTMILQSLQWDRKHLLKQRTMVACQYNAHHRVPPDKIMEHESGCFLKSQGYLLKDRLLPSPVDPDASTLVKLDADNIADIINNASRGQALFKTGPGCSGTQPLTLERLQATYTADERRAIHDAVVAKVPSCHDLSDLALLSSKDDESKEVKPKSKLEILAELRDMKRRRPKYRVAAKTRNYSDVLRDVITTQMELYTQAQDNPMDRDKKEKVESSQEVEEDNRLNHKNTIEYNTASNQRLNAPESRYDRVDHHHESRKRRHNYTYDAYNSTKSSKTWERDRTRSSREYRDTPHRSTIKRNDNIKRDDRHTHFSRASRDEHKYYDDYEKRKRHRDTDDHADYRRKNYTKTVPLPIKDIKKEKLDLTKNYSSGSTSKRYDDKTSQDRRNSSEVHRSNIEREKQKYDQRTSVDNEKSNKMYTDQQKLEQTVQLKTENYSSDNDSDSRYDNESEYTERTKVYDKSKRTHHSYKAHYSNIDKERKKHYLDNRKNGNGHGPCKEENNSQVENTAIKVEIKDEQEGTDSNYSESNISKSTESYHKYQKTLRKSSAHGESYKHKYRDNDTYEKKNTQHEKVDSHRPQEHEETVEQDSKLGILIKEELDSGKDDSDDGTHISDNRYRNRRSSYRYDTYKNSSKSHKERSKEYSEPKHSRKRHEDSDRYKKYKKH